MPSNFCAKFVETDTFSMTPEEQEAAAKAAAASTATPPATATDNSNKVYEIGKGWVDKPATVEFANPDFAPHKEPVIVEQKPTTTTEPPKTDPPKTDPPVTTTPAFNKDKYSKYGIEKEEDITTTLDALDTLMKENEELKKKPAEIPFESETHKKLYDFLKPYPESSWQEVLKTGAEIVGMDPDAADGTKVLQEAFVISHPMVSREDAIILFQEQHANKYNLKPKEEYEDPARFERDKKLKEIEMKIEVDKARQVVREKKAQLTVAAKTETAAASKFEAPADQVRAYTQEIENVLNGTTKGSGLAFLDKDTIRVKADDKGEPMINIQLPADKLKELKETALVHIKNPHSYDKSGKISNFDASKDTLRLAFALWPEWISQQMAKQVDTLASIKKAEQIASTTPDKIETVAGKDVKTMSVDEQLRELAKKEKEKRENGGQPRR